MNNDWHDHCERLLHTHRTNLRYLEERAALYGMLHVPLCLYNEINGEKAKIADLEGQIQGEIEGHTLAWYFLLCVCGFFAVQRKKFAESNRYRPRKGKLPI